MNTENKRTQTLTFVGNPPEPEASASGSASGSSSGAAAKPTGRSRKGGAQGTPPKAKTGRAKAEDPHNSGKSQQTQASNDNETNTGAKSTTSIAHGFVKSINNVKAPEPRPTRWTRGLLPRLKRHLLTNPSTAVSKGLVAATASTLFVAVRLSTMWTCLQ